MSFQRFREHVTVATSSNFTTISTVPSNIDGLKFSIISGETWIVDAQLTAQCSGNGGIQYLISAPSGSSIEGWILSFLGNSSISTQRLTAVNKLIPPIHTGSGGLGPDKFRFTIHSAASGSVSIQAASKTSGQTSTIFSLSSMEARRI